MSKTEPNLFRKKPVAVQAIQYPCAHPALRRCSCDINSACSSCGREFIETLEGRMNVSAGDWIITGVQGEHYPCKPDIFAATYEPAHAPLASMARAIFGDQIGGQMDAMAGTPVPPASAQDDAKDEGQADACPRCDGSGEITVASDNSPDAHDVDVCCDHCQGSGAAADAAKYLAAALSGEKYRHMQLWAEFRNFHRSLCARVGYGHDEVHFRRDLVSLEEAIAARLAAPAAEGAYTAAARDVLAERQRQVSGEGFSTPRDDGYANLELADAAAQYALQAGGWPSLNVWPWKPDTFKEGTAREMLVKAGALILAEIERQDRAGLSAQPGAQKYWLCCGSKDPNHSNRRAPDCFNAAKAKWGTADQHSAAQKNGGSDAE